MAGTVLTPAQQTQYYAEQGNAATPLSPTAWLASKSPAPAPTATTPSGAVVNTATGALVTAPKPITLTADSMNNPASLTQVPIAPKAPNYAATLAAIPTIESITTQKSPEQVAAESENKTLQDRILSVLGTLGGRSTAQANAENDAGIPDIQKQLTDVNTQIATLQNEAKAIPIQDQKDAEGRGITVAGLEPVDAAKIRNNTIQALGLSSIAATLQGNLGLAQQQVAAKISAMFDPMQAQLDYLKTALDFNAANLSEADKAQATTVSAKLQERQDALDQAKADHTQTMNYVLSAAQNGAPAATLSQAQNLDPAAAASLLKQWLPSDQKPLIVGKGDTVIDPVTGKPIFTNTGGGNGGNTFTQTQLNKGAANAGMSIADFGNLSSDAQNYFVNSFSTFTAQQKLIASGQKTKQEVASDIVNSQTLSPDVQNTLLRILGVSRTDAMAGSTGGGGGLWGGIKSATGSVMNWLGI